MDLNNANFQEIYNEFPASAVEEEDIVLLRKDSTGEVHGIKGKDFSVEQDLSSFIYSSTATYNIDDAVIFNSLWYLSTINGNTGIIPGGGGGEWVQINKIQGSTLRRWVPGLVTSDEQYVVHNLILYELNPEPGTARPFNSVSDPATDTANWSAVGGGGSGSNTEIVATYNDMITFPGPQNAQMFYVLDASGDPTVNSGGAQYIYYAVGAQFIKIAEFESQDIDFTDFTRNSTGESNLDYTPADTSFYSTILTGGKAKLKAAMDFLTGNRNKESVEAQVQTSLIDLAGKEIIVLNQTANIAGFDYTNEEVGRTYTLVVDRTSNLSFTWATGKFAFPFGVIPTPTNPNTNNSTPAFARDIYTFICIESGILTAVELPDIKTNN